MRKFPKLRYPNHPDTDGLMAGEVVVTEKLDGANFRFTWDDDGELRVGTRNHTHHADGRMVPKAFQHAINYIREQMDGWAVDKGWPTETTLFGEAMHLHSLEYEDVEYNNPSSGSPHFGEGYPSVVLFDAWQDGKWMHWDQFESLVKSTPFESTKVLERGNAEDLTFDYPDESMFGGMAEGIVARRVDGTVRAKKVTEDFKETNAAAFNDASKAQTDAGEFVATYITDARIEKRAHKLVDEGEYDYLKMHMMEDLPRIVLEDAMAENGWDLLTSGSIEVEWDDDFKAEVRSKASTKCSRVLRTMCQEF